MSAIAARPPNARAVGDGHGLGVHRVDAARGAERVGELAADLGDLPHRHEGRHGEQREERQHAAVEPPARREPRRRRATTARPPRPVATSCSALCSVRSRRNGTRTAQVVAAPWRRTPRPAPARCWKATISPRPCTESTAWAFRSPDTSRAREPSRSIRARAEDGRERGVGEERQEHQRERPAEGRRAWRAPPAGTRTATKAGVMVWAKKYSISSMSWVATPTRSPVRRRVR